MLLLLVNDPPLRNNVHHVLLLDYLVMICDLPTNFEVPLSDESFLWVPLSVESLPCVPLSLLKAFLRFLSLLRAFLRFLSLLRASSCGESRWSRVGIIHSFIIFPQVPLSGESFLKEVHGSIQTWDQSPLVLTKANQKLIDHSFGELSAHECPCRCSD